MVQDSTPQIQSRAVGTWRDGEAHNRSEQDSQQEDREQRSRAGRLQGTGLKL